MWRRESLEMAMKTSRLKPKVMTASTKLTSPVSMSLDICRCRGLSEHSPLFCCAASPLPLYMHFVFFLVLAFLNLSFLLLRSLRQACASIEFRPFWRGKGGRDDVRKCEVNEAMKRGTPSSERRLALLGWRIGELMVDGAWRVESGRGAGLMGLFWENKK